MNVWPQEVARVGERELRIVWSDGERRIYAIQELRDACPCATCREKKTAPPPAMGMLPVLSAAEARPLALKGMEPVGNYAYSLEFSDGHDSGIYTLELLKSLGRIES